MIQTHCSTNNIDSFTTSTSYKISKSTNSSTGKGTTHKIRQILNFTDEKRWKQFSSRRLELIDKFGLSERKASEQDDNIKQIANMLREEFKYPMDSINEFEKLVTAAVQSVRRNRKRSKKKFENSGSSSSSSSSSNSASTSSSNSSICSPLENKQKLFTATTNNNASTIEAGNIDISSTDYSSISNNDKVTYPSQPSFSTNTTNNAAINNNSSNSSSSSNTGLGSPLLSPPSSVQGKFDCPKIISLPVTSSRSSSSCSLSNTITSPLSLKRPQSNTPLPTIQNQYMLTIRSLCFELFNIKFERSIKFKNSSNSTNVPDFLLDKLITIIQNSKTFLSFTDQNQNYSFQNDKWQNLEVLGEMCTKASISFVIERYFIDHDTLNQDKKFSIDFLKQLSSTLFGEIFKHHDIDMFTQIKFLYFIIGAIVKDYGFDSVLYPLNEIIHHLIQNRSNVESSMFNKAQPLLPPLNNGLNILSVVSSQVSNSSYLSPEYTHRETLPSVSMFMQNNNNKNNLPSPTPSFNKSISATTSNTATNNANMETGSHTSSHGPLPQLIVKESFASGTLPQPIKQIL